MAAKSGAHSLSGVVGKYIAWRGGLAFEHLRSITEKGSIRAKGFEGIIERTLTAARDYRERTGSILKNSNEGAHTKKRISIIRPFAVLLAATIFGVMAFAQMPPENQPDMTIDEKIKTEVVEKLEKALNDNYVFPNVGDKLIKMLEEHQAHGDYNSITSAKQFAKLLTQQMSDIAHDPHLHVIYMTQLQRPTMLPGGGRNPENSGLVKVEQLAGNLGYLKILAFAWDMNHAGPVAAGAMAFLANTDALIIDLRENRGGAPDMVAFLASYFFDSPVHLNDIELRKPGTRDYELEQHWTDEYVPGQRYLKKELYILTSHSTPSAAEEFTYDLQALKRATIVGEVTWGGANPGGVTPLVNHFAVFLPQGHAINPVTHTNWEGVGITPDIAVPAADALKVAQKTALEHLIAQTSNARELGVLKQALANVEGKSEAQKP